MLKIICPHCGQNHKGKDVKTVTRQITEGKLTYKTYHGLCAKCGQDMQLEKYVQKNLKNKASAIKKYNSSHKKSYDRMGCKPEHIIREEAERLPNENAKALIWGIILQAAIDSNKPKRKKDVQEFWDSEWGKELCAAIGQNSQKAKENLKNGLPEELKRVLVD